MGGIVTGTSYLLLKGKVVVHLLSGSVAVLSVVQSVVVLGGGEQGQRGAGWTGAGQRRTEGWEALLLVPVTFC